jgi:hypothetical protein
MMIMIALGSLFLGAMIGFFLASILAAGKRADIAMGIEEEV